MSRGTGESAESFQRYLRDVRRLPRLEPGEEERLILVLEDGRRAAAELAKPDGSVGPSSQGESRLDLEERERRGREARDRIVLGNLRFVIHAARRYVRRCGIHGLELSDLIQEGNLSLIRATERYEPGRGKLAAFAARWIWRSFNRAVRDQGRVVRIPVHVHEKLERMRQEQQWYLDEKGRPPTSEELARELEIDVAALSELRGAERDVESLDQPVAGNEDEEEEVTQGDLVEDPRAAAFARRVEDRRWLAWLLADLDERRRRILIAQVGFEETLDEVGRRENVSRERIRQITREALERLRR